MAYLMDWLELFTRPAHVIAGSSWIGALFYIMHLDEPGLRRRRTIAMEPVIMSMKPHSGRRP